MLNYEFSMKKLFFIFLIFFLFNNTAFGKELKIECTVKKTDEKGNFYQIGDKTVWTYDLSSKKYIVTDDFIKHYHLAKIKDKYFLQFIQIFRYTGQFVQKTYKTKQYISSIKFNDLEDIVEHAMIVKYLGRINNLENKPYVIIPDLQDFKSFWIQSMCVQCFY